MDTRREREPVVGRGQDLVGLSAFAEAGRQVHGPAHVIVAVEEDHRARGDAAAKGQPASRLMVELELDDGRHQGLGLHAHEHHAVAEPLVDAHAGGAGRLPHAGAQDAELGDRGVVAVDVDEVGEPAQIDEGEAPKHPGRRARRFTPGLGARSAHRPSTAGACSPSAGYIRVERLGAHVARSQ